MFCDTEGQLMTALLELAPRVEGDAPVDLDVEFETGVGAGTDPNYCTHCCGDWSTVFVPSSYYYAPGEDD
jgi:hypothetical protein